MEQDATQNMGVSQEEEQVSTRSARDEMLEAIAAKATEERNRELGIVEEERQPQEEEPKKEERQPQEEEPKTEDETGKPSGEAEEQVKLVVDGQERLVPVSQLIETGKRALQKDLAADKRLEEASRLLREAKDLAGKRAATGDSSDAASRPNRDAVAQEQQDAEKVSEWVKAIQYGDEKEASKAVKEILRASRNQAPSYSTELVERTVSEKLRQQAIVERFKTEFGDVAGEPYLADMAVRKAGELLQSGEYQNDWELYRKAGESVREWRDKLIGKTKVDENKPDELAQRREKKRELDTVKAVTAKTESTVKEQVPQTQAEIIAEMRKARGQPI